MKTKNRILIVLLSIPTYGLLFYFFFCVLLGYKVENYLPMILGTTGIYALFAFYSIYKIVQQNPASTDIQTQKWLFICAVLASVFAVVLGILGHLFGVLTTPLTVPISVLLTFGLTTMACLYTFKNKEHQKC